MFEEEGSLPTEDQNQLPKSKKKIFIILLSVLVILIIAIGAWYYFDYLGRDKKNITNNLPSQVEAKDDTAAILEKVSKLIVLPTEEQPAVATILDAQSLADQQAFYSGSSDGDILLLYADRAIIYNPKNNILINVGTVKVLNELPDDDEEEVVEEPEEPVAEQKETPEILKLDIRNGSGQVGAAKVLGDQLGINDQYEITNIGNASNNGYTNTQIINLTGFNISFLEGELGLSATTALPAGEASSLADVIIIIGK